MASNVKGQFADALISSVLHGRENEKKLLDMLGNDAYEFIRPSFDAAGVGSADVDSEDAEQNGYIAGVSSADDDGNGSTSTNGSCNIHGDSCS